MNKKVVLVNSEWLDIPMALKWLSNKGYEVICFVGNLVQKEDLDKVIDGWKISDIRQNS